MNQVITLFVHAKVDAFSLAKGCVEEDVQEVVLGKVGNLAKKNIYQEGKMNYSSKIGLENGNARFCFACWHNCSLSCNTTCKGGCSAKCDNGCSGNCGANCQTTCISSAGV